MKNLLIQAFDEPNHTQTPNKFFDMIPDMSEAELRVTLVMIRHTLGYHKNTFKMGMQKLGDASGLTRQGAMAGAEAAEQRGIFKRSNPDSQKEAEWELNLLPVNVDDMSTSLTLSVNVDDTKCNPRLQQSPIKESIKEKKDIVSLSKRQLANTSIQAAIFGGMPITEEMMIDARLKDEAPKMFEAALGFSRPLAWTSDKDWTSFEAWVLGIYRTDPKAFERFETWRNTPYVKGSISNNRIRGFVNEFYDAWDMFKKQDAPQVSTSSMFETLS